MSLGRSLDSTLTPGEEIRFKQRHKAKMQHFTKISHFTYDEIEHLCIMYCKLEKLNIGKTGCVRKSQIRDVLHCGLDMTETRFLPFVISVCERKLGPYMTMENWIKMLSLFLRGTLEEKIEYSYKVYVSIGFHSEIVRSTMLNLLRRTIIKDNNESDEESIKDMVEIITKKMDKDRDGKISFDEFRYCVLAKPELLQCFGKILPDRLAVTAFKTTFTTNVGKL